MPTAHTILVSVFGYLQGVGHGAVVFVGGCSGEVTGGADEDASNGDLFNISFYIVSALQLTPCKFRPCLKNKDV